MGLIKNIYARQIFDSRGNPTIEVDVITNKNNLGRASVPSGASVGKYEAKYLYDGNKEYRGKGVKMSIKYILTIIKEALIGEDITNQKVLDYRMIQLDGTLDKSKIGANTILGVSSAIAKAAAAENNLPLYKYLNPADTYTLPIPMLNVLNGGVHADNPIDFQEFLILPVKVQKFSQALTMGITVFHTLGEILKKNKYSTNVGDEGGFAPNLSSYHVAFEYILQAIEQAGYTPGKDILIGLDAAASELYNSHNKKYFFRSSSLQESYTTDDMIMFWDTLIKKYPIYSIEDPLAEDDWLGWQKLTKKIGHKIKLVGDDLFVTNSQKLQQGINQKVANTILIKPNQVGTLTETKNTIDLAKKAAYTHIISHRSGETEDTMIADLSVAYQASQIKSGSLTRSERVAKYNQILRIEEALGKYATYYGEKFIP